MLASNIPAKFAEPFAKNATAGFIRPIPTTSGDPTVASLDLGFPPATATPIGAGGVPPNIQDMNGILYQISAWAQWLAAGGAFPPYDATFQATIGGYPQGAVVGSVATPGTFWLSTADSNVTNPDAAGAGWITFGPPALSLAHGECLLNYVSTTAISLTPKNGCNVLVAGVQKQIPSAGIAAANTGVTVNGVAGQALAASTVYLVAFDGAALEYWTLATGHSTDSTAGNIGVEIITGHPTKTLVGMVMTDGSSHFSSFLTLSWFNQVGKHNTTSFSTTRSTTSLSFVEINTEIRNTFITWAGQEVTFYINGSAANTGPSSSTSTGVGFDSTTVAAPEQSGIGGAGPATIFGRKSGLAEGAHFATLLGEVGAGTGSWSGAAGTTPVTLGIAVSG